MKEQNNDLLFMLKGICKSGKQLWDLKPRPSGPEPKSGALDHSAKLSPYENFENLCNSKLK